MTGDEDDVVVDDVLGEDDDTTTVPPVDPDPGAGDVPPLDPGSDGTFGQDESQYWQQQSENGFCVPMSVTMMLREFGIEVTELDVVKTALDNGWLIGQPGAWQGMMPADAEKLLETYGIPAQTMTGTIEDLAVLVEQRHDVMIAVDSSEIWDGVSDDITEAGVRQDHALLVTEIDPNTMTVTLNDPGHPEGAGMEIPLELFADAWDDSGNTMVVTEAAPGETATPEAEVETPPEPQFQPGLPATPGTEPTPEQVSPVTEPIAPDAPQPTTAAPTEAAEPATSSPSEGDAEKGDLRATIHTAGSVGAIILPLYITGAEVKAATERRRERK